MPSPPPPVRIRLFRLLSSLFFLLFTTLPAGADEPLVQKDGHPLPKKGPMVSQFREDLSDEIDGPETVVRKYEDGQGNQVLEFLINGAIFEIQVIPADGRPYLLIDTKGDGLFDSRFNGHEPRLVVPQWVFFRF